MSTVISCFAIVSCLQIEPLTLRGARAQRAFLSDGEHVQAELSSKIKDFILKNTARRRTGEGAQVSINTIVKNKINPKDLCTQRVESLAFLKPIQEEKGLCK